VETRQEKVGKEETKMSSVSWFEPGLVVGKPFCFPRGSEERRLSGLDAETPANYANRWGHLLWLSLKGGGQLS